MTVFNGKHGQIELMSAQGMLHIIERLAFFDIPKADNIKDGTRLLAQMQFGIVDQYRPGSADRIALSRRRRLSKLERLNLLGSDVRDRLAMGWSPEQIAGRLKLE
ncbi:MAG: hypothetical protein VCE74_05165, partial [Alphaproteobacteria bacterium]